MNTNMTRLDGFQKSLHHCALDERTVQLGIGRVKMHFDLIPIYPKDNHKYVLSFPHGKIT